MGAITNQKTECSCEKSLNQMLLVLIGPQSIVSAVAGVLLSSQLKLLARTARQ